MAHSMSLRQIEIVREGEEGELENRLLRTS
jgi:hypothetical protein